MRRLGAMCAIVLAFAEPNRCIEYLAVPFEDRCGLVVVDHDPQKKQLRNAETQSEKTGSSFPRD